MTEIDVRGIPKMSKNSPLVSSEDGFVDDKDEYHIASFVAFAILTKLNEVKEAINNTIGSEIHATSPEGKVVFTLEGSSQKVIGKRIDELKFHTGLINLSPVYHQYLDETQTSN